MNRFLRSLYARLALVLLLALGASFATMYLLFEARLEDTRDQHLARGLAAQVNLVEALLRAEPGADLSRFSDLRLAREAPAATRGTMWPPASMRQALSEELGRNVEMVAGDPPGGFWVKLDVAAEQPSWLFFPPHHPHPHRGDSFFVAMLVGFAVFFAGGLALLWQVQRPLKRLGAALEAVGQATPAAPLPVAGPGETRALAQRYNDMVERLSRYEEDRATMLAGVAHDLRTPLTRMRLLAELSDGARGGEIAHNIDDMERIVEQFLAYARGSDDETWEERDLDLFVQEVAAPYSDRVTVALPNGDTPPVRLRANALRRALVNLIENALEYGAAPVSVTAVRRDGRVGVAVEDCGTGIPADQIDRALRPFTRLESARGGKGHCGLGLVIAAKAAQAHGGELELRNRIDSRGFVAEMVWPT